MVDDGRAEELRSEIERRARELAAEALEEAAGRARGILIERLTETLVSAAEHFLAEVPTLAPAERPDAPEPPTSGTEPAPAEQAAPTEEAAEREAASGCYLFAIAESGGAPLPSLQGMDGSGPVREVVSGRLGAVACDVPLGLFDGLDQEPVGPGSRLAELARRHDEVVRATFERRAVLPLRFGTVLTSERQLMGVLEEEQAQLLAELRRLEGKAEWTCRVSPDPAAANAAARPERPAIGGAAYLAERERQLAAAEEEPSLVAAAADRVSEAVAAHVESGLPPDPAGEETRVSFLVSEGAQERFADAVAAVAEATPAVRIELLGPHPPYHFATVQLGREV